MAIDSSTRFGVVYSTPKDFIEKISSKDSAYTNGKLFVLHGDAQGALTQGIYMVEQNDADPDGSLNIQMLSSGTYASSTNAGLMSAADVATLSNALSKADASNTYLKINDASFFRTVTVKNGTATTNIVADSSRDTLTISAGSNIKLTGNASNDTLTIEATDTTYTGTAPINVSGTAISHANSGVTAGRYGDVDTSTGRTLAFGDKFKVVDISVNAFGHVTSAISRELTLPSKPATAGTADEAKKTTGTLTFKVNGTDASAFNGSANTSIDISAGTNISISEASDGVIKISTSGVPTTTEMNNAINTALSSALQYKGTVNDVSVLPTIGNKVGDVYVCSTLSSGKTYYETKQNDVSVRCESGDLFIWNGTYFDIVNGENQVDNKAVTLNPSTNEQTLTIATVDGTDITVKVPAKGSAYYTHPVAGKPTQSLGNAAKSTTVTIGNETKIATVYDVSFDASGHYKGKVARDISINITSNNTDEKVKASASDGTFYLIGHDDATGTVAETAYKNASAYVNDGYLYSGGAKVLTSYTEKYTGTVTSITPGTGLTNGTTENDITSSGTLNLKTSSATEIGGIIASNVLTTDVSLTSANGATASRYYGVQVDKSGKAFVNIPWVDTWREVYVGNTKVLTSATDSSALKFVNGTNITATWNSTDKTIKFDASGLATDAEVATAKSEAIEAATIYWETL